jgi:hypothetical protein
MEHIEEAGIHSGDSSCVLPTYQLGEDLREEIRKYTVRLGRALNVVGLMNIQFAIRAGTGVLEVTVVYEPCVCQQSDRQRLAKIAAVDDGKSRESDVE